MICPHCHQQHPDNARFCPVTGLEIPIGPMYCPHCQNEILPGQKICLFCGNVIDVKQTEPSGETPPIMVPSPAQPQNRSRWTGLLIILGIFLIGGIIFLVFSMKGRETAEQLAAAMTATSDALAAVQVSLETPVVAPTEPIPTPEPSQTPLPTETPEPTATLEPSPTPANLPVALQVNPIDGAEIVLVPAGEFLMGSDPKFDPYFYGAEGPQHMVTLDEYWIYRTEVTNAMYQKCVDVQACPRPTNFGSNSRSEYYNSPAYVDYPVVYVSWRHAAAYCSWAGGRLPTEAEWEKAARGTDGRLFPWGNDRPTDQLARFNATDTVKVGIYPDGASPYGVLDMAGNVIEWVYDFFQAGYYSISPQDNPMGPGSGSTRVYRGGSYHNPVDGIRVVMRGSRTEDHSNVDIGFRCVILQP